MDNTETVQQTRSIPSLTNGQLADLLGDTRQSMKALATTEKAAKDELEKRLQKSARSNAIGDRWSAHLKHKTNVYLDIGAVAASMGTTEAELKERFPKPSSFFQVNLTPVA